MTKLRQLYSHVGSFMSRIPSGVVRYTHYQQFIQTWQGPCCQCLSGILPDAQSEELNASQWEHVGQVEIRFDGVLGGQRMWSLFFGQRTESRSSSQNCVLYLQGGVILIQVWEEYIDLMSQVLIQRRPWQSAPICFRSFTWGSPPKMTDITVDMLVPLLFRNLTSSPVWYPLMHCCKYSKPIMR